jgi:hypothetical protein
MVVRQALEPHFQSIILLFFFFFFFGDGGLLNYLPGLVLNLYLLNLSPLSS